MRQGTLTGKVKKLKLTEEEIKAAQEFAEKNLDMKYGDDLLVSEELAKKAKVDLPATALAKIEAVIRKAKRTKKAKKHGQTDFATGGIAGELHLNRPGYQQGNEVLPPSLRGTRTNNKKVPYWVGKIMSYDKDVMPEEYKIPGSGGYGSILRHAGNTALLKKHLSEKMEPYTGKGIADLVGAVGAFGGGTLHELTAESPIWADEKRTVDEALPFDVGLLRLESTYKRKYYGTQNPDVNTSIDRNDQSLVAKIQITGRLNKIIPFLKALNKDDSLFYTLKYQKSDVDSTILQNTVETETLNYKITKRLNFSEFF